jgi:TonB family protein
MNSYGWSGMRERAHRRRRPPLAAGRSGVIAALVLGACGDVRQTWDRLRGNAPLVELPVLASTELPFRYPPALYARQVQGSVTLRLYIDSSGRVVPESTRVAESAPQPAFDSAALEGSGRLEFRPARRGDREIGYAVLFPIRFRVPGAPPLPEDTMPVRK